MDEQLITTLKAMSEIYGKELTPAAAQMILEDLKGFPTFEILKALSKCRKELSRFPTISDIISRIDDGRPGVEEAWGMIPKDEYSSVIWTEEMAIAYSAAAPLIQQDHIAARLAFKEKYEKLITEAKANGSRAKWSASFGFDRNHRETVVFEAISKNRISVSDARKILPELEMSPKFAVLEDKQERTISIEKKTNIAEPTKLSNLLPSLISKSEKKS